jgi:predicted nucleotidyltransferase
MVEILKIGSFLRTDEEGYLVSDSAPEKIVPPWREPVEEVARACVRHLGEKLHSVYVRGSVARGQAIERVSDLDMLAVVRADPDTLDLSWKRELQKRMAESYPFQTGVELELIPHDWLLRSDEASWVRFKIAVQCACVRGEDLRGSFPRFRPGKDIALHVWPLRSEIRRVVGRLQGTDDPRGVAEECGWLMKRIVRAGLELVMEREGVYTRDLRPCYEAFAKHYPEREPSMRRALEWAIEPSSERREILAFLAEIAPWLLAEIERIYPRPAKSFPARLRSRIRRALRVLVTR